MKTKIIFFGNGTLADFALRELKNCSNLEIIFHAKSKDDLDRVKILKQENPAALGVLASFGVLIKEDLLSLFEPLGILNIHPSLLPKYRGASPIESAILAGDTDFSVSVMKLVKKMDAGPVFYQKTFKNLPLEKSKIYEQLAAAGTAWIIENLPVLKSLKSLSDYHNLIIQDDSRATFTKKFEKRDGFLTPETDPADLTLRKIIAFQDFPKPKLTLFGKTCIILSAEKTSANEQGSLSIRCADNQWLKILRLQPESRKPMDAKSFLNGIR
ncbi:hypothetical protein IJI70_01650 [Candidatus Saccharibacteria bacterium]|nr:hypothetical protein [Candidatus Saccharibacteria bacterium]